MAKTGIAQALAAAVFVAVGLLALFIATDYPLGTLTRMGPGFFPIAIAIVLIICSVGAGYSSRHLQNDGILSNWRPFLLIMGGIAFWGVTINLLGFFVATFGLVVCCASAELEQTPFRVIVLAGTLSILGYGLFVLALGIPLTPFGR